MFVLCDNASLASRASSAVSCLYQSSLSTEVSSCSSRVDVRCASSRGKFYTAVEAERCGWQMTDRLWGDLEGCGVGGWVAAGIVENPGQSKTTFQQRALHTLRGAPIAAWIATIHHKGKATIREEETACGALRLCTEKQEFKWNSLSCLTHRLTGETVIYFSTLLVNIAFIRSAGSDSITHSSSPHC